LLHLACEADWPPAYRVNRWVKEISSSTIKDADDALKDFTPFPSWMWLVITFFFHFILIFYLYIYAKTSKINS
jgi:hypothetical protein